MKEFYSSTTGNKFDMRARHLASLDRAASARAASRQAARDEFYRWQIGGPISDIGREDFAYDDGAPAPSLPFTVKESSDTSGAGAGSGYSGSSPLTYSDWSPAAKMFGMDRSTAYEEHLANTAHQREVADLKAAGLNPVLGLSSGAPTVSGSYVGGSGYGSTAKKTFFKDVADVLGSVAGMIVLAKSKNKYAGSWTASMTSKAFSYAGKLLDDIFK